MADISLNDVLGRIDDSSILALTQQLVRMESINPPAEYGEISAFLERWLSNVPGAEVKVLEPRPGKRNVVARLRGKGGLSLMVSSHMDVVPAGDPSEWSRPPFAAEIAEGRMWGRGTTDMKGSTSAQLHAFKAIAEAGQPTGDVYIACTVDDETAGDWGMKYLVERGFAEIGWPLPAFHILGEPTCLEIVSSFKGRLWIELKIRGRAAHGGNPSRGVNAIDQMVRLTDAIRPLLAKNTHPLVGPDTFNLGVIEGGSQVNMVPEFCRARIDLRFGPAWTTEKLLADVRKVVERVSKEAPTFSVENFDVFERREAIEVDPDNARVKLLAQCSESIVGRVPRFQGTLASGDLYHSARGGIPGVYWGPGNMALAHTTNEYVETSELASAARVFATAMVRMTA